MANRRRKGEAVTDFLFWGPKITEDGDCSHKIRRQLPLVRKAMTNLESVLKSKDITLPTEIHIVKAVIFPVVMYDCKNWTVKKAECQRIDVFELWCWRWLVRVPWIARRSNQSTLREINFEYSLEELMLKLKHQYFGHLMQRANTLGKNPNAGRGWRQKEKRVTEVEMTAWHHWFKGHELGQTLGDGGEGQGSLHAAVHRIGKSPTWPGNWRTNFMRGWAG